MAMNNLIAPSVEANNPGSRFSAPQINDAPARELAMLGKGIGEVGETLFRIEETANRTREADALNRVIEAEQRLEFDKEQGFRYAKGLNAFERPSKTTLENEFGGMLSSEIKQIANGLGNDIQRERFMSRAQERLTAFRGRVMKHETDEFRNYHQSVHEGAIKNRMNDIALHYNNPDAIEENAAYIKASAIELSKMLGRSAEWTEAYSRKAISDAYRTAIVAATENNDPSYAMGLFDKFGKEMDADDQLRVRGLVTKEMSKHIGLQAANSIYNQMILPSISPSDSSRAFNIAVGTESNYRQFSNDGKPLESIIYRNGERVEGAIGIAQVMRGTGPEAAKLAGLPWDEKRWKNDAGYNYAIGKAYFDQQLKTFNGDVTKAWAAYNWGPGNVQRASEEFEKQQKNSRVPLDPLGWLNVKFANKDGKTVSAPKETRNYVLKNLEKFSRGGGRPKKMTEEDIENQLRTDPVLAQNPDAMRVAREDAKRRLEAHNKAEKQRGEEALTTAYDILSRNSGNINELPQRLLEMVPPDKRDSLMTYAEKMQKGTKIVDDLAVYQDVRERIAMGEVVNLQAYKDTLSHATLKQLADMQTKVRDGNSPIVPEWQLKRAYADLGITNKDKQGAFAKYIEDQARLVEKAKGREPTYDEIQVLIKGAMTQTDQGWFGGKELYRLYGTPEFDSAHFQIPSEMRRQIEVQLEKEGIPKTDAAVYDRFQRAMRIGAYSPANMRRRAG